MLFVQKDVCIYAYALSIKIAIYMRGTYRGGCYCTYNVVGRNELVRGKMWHINNTLL